MIRAAISESNVIESNRRITFLHSQLGKALQAVIGPEAGPNFHHWAAWGSLKAAETIGQRQLPRALRDLSVCLAVIAGIVGLALALLVSLSSASLLLPFVLVAFTVLAGRWFIKRAMRHSAAAILEGNRTVLDDIGHKTAEFLECFDGGRPNAKRLRRFFKKLRPGAAAAGGQDLLRRAFRSYLHAIQTKCRKERCEAVYFGNCLAVLHEHYRLQPYIEASMPWIVRRYATRFLMTFCVGRLQYAVHRDLPGISGQAFPPILQEIADPGLLRFLTKWDRSNGQLAATGVADWTRLHERMNFIVNLFRSLHGEEQVVAEPLQGDYCSSMQYK